MKKQREQLLRRSYDLSLCDIFDDKDFFDVRLELNNLERKVDEANGETVKFRVEYGYEYTDVYMDIFREEDDEEYERRMEKEAKAKEKARLAREKKKAAARKVLMETEAAEREEYLRLKEKFGE